ncbi:MAG: hypothetical protein Q8L46_00360 [candidate division WWE3 bacterium]|nr:hypothetical protein [candidate division WWE3 bacterium]
MMPEKSSRFSLILPRAREAFRAAEARLSAMSRRRAILTVLALAAGFALIGALLGIFLTPYRPTSTPNLDSSSANGDNQISSYTGIVRALDEPKEGASYYLELENGTRLLLKSINIDISFFKGASVTAEGVVVGTSDVTQQLLFVNRIRLK